MKQISLLLFIFCSVNLMAQSGSQVSFEAKTLYLDEMKSGERDTFMYYFTNTGHEDLNLWNMRATCGCTVADYPKYPIAPGQRDSITAIFDSTGKQGLNAKGINMESNAGEIHLIFEVNIVGKLENAKPQKVVPHNHQH